MDERLLGRAGTSRMEATVLLSKAMGLCLIVIGAAIILRRCYFLSVFTAAPLGWVAGIHCSPMK